MKSKPKFSFTPKNKRIRDLFQQESVQNKKQINPINIIQLEEPKEESFHFLSPRKSAKIKFEEEDDIYKTEMNNKKPLELFQELANDVNENNKAFGLKQNLNINSYDCDNNMMDKSNISGSFSNIINQNNSNDKIDDTNNSTVKYNTMNSVEDSKNNFDNKDNNKLRKFCQNMMNRKNMSIIHDEYDRFIMPKKNGVEQNLKRNTKEQNISNNIKINNYKYYENYYINSHILYLRNLNNKKCTCQYSNIKAKLIKTTPRNNNYNSSCEELNNIFNEDNNQKNKILNSRISFDNSLSFCNKKIAKFNSVYNTSRAYSLINTKQNKVNNQNSLFLNSAKTNGKNNIKIFSFSKFIYKKRIIKNEKTHIKNNDIYNEEKQKINRSSLRNNKLNVKSFRRDKEMINTFRLNIKPIKRKEIINQSEFESKKEKPINLQNKPFYSDIYESLIKKQKENFKNNIIIQNFNNYNLNTYNSNKNINPKFVNFDNYKRKDDKKINKVNDDIKNKGKNIILNIKVNKRCFSKIEKRHKNFIL